jgi:hypothetical protein
MINFVDRDNGLPAEYAIPSEPDVILLTLTSDSIDVTLWGQHAALQLTASKGLSVHYDDLACSDYAKHVELDLPRVTAKCLLSCPELQNEMWLEVAAISFDISLAMGLCSSGWEQKAEEQLSYVRKQDALTRRCPFLYEEETSGKMMCLAISSCTVFLC